MRKIKDAKDLSTNELIYFKGHAKATYMSDGRNVEEAINQIGTGGGGGGIIVETDPVFSASPAASITEAKKAEWDGKQDAIEDLNAIRTGAEKGATALQPYITGFTYFDFETAAVNKTNLPISESEAQGLIDAINDGRIILIPCYDGGYALTLATISNPEVYVTVYFNTSIINATFFLDDILQGNVLELDSSETVVSNVLAYSASYDADAHTIPIRDSDGSVRVNSLKTDDIQVDIDEIRRTIDSLGDKVDKDEVILKDANGELITAQTQALCGGGAVYALPDQATGDEDDVLLSRGKVKTINGQSIFGSGNIEISGGGDSLWQEDSEGRAFCDRDIHVDGNISTSSTFIIGSIGVPLLEGYATGDKGQILRANGDGSIGWDDLSIPTKVSQLENDNVYITDFNLQDLNDVYEGEVRQIRYEDLGNAILEKKRILVPSYEHGFCLLTGESYGDGSEIYCTIYTSEGIVYYLAIADGILDSEHTWRDNLTQAKVMPVTCGEINSLAEANGFLSQEGMCYALPDTATGDEDGILLSSNSVKTINGQDLFVDENSNDIITTYKRITTNLSSVELLPNSVTEWAGPVLSQELVLSFGEQLPQGYVGEYIAKFYVGADGVQLIVPDNVVWADGVYPAMTNGKTYEISFVDNLATFLEF